MPIFMDIKIISSTIFKMFKKCFWSVHCQNNKNSHEISAQFLHTHKNINYQYLRKSFLKWLQIKKTILPNIPPQHRFLSYLKDQDTKYKHAICFHISDSLVFSGIQMQTVQSKSEYWRIVQKHNFWINIWNIYTMNLDLLFLWVWLIYIS